MNLQLITSTTSITEIFTMITAIAALYTAKITSDAYKIEIISKILYNYSKPKMLESLKKIKDYRKDFGEDTLEKQNIV
jgi:hypothetical protein